MSMKHWKIKTWSPHEDTPPLMVAELGANHGGDLNRALALVDAAADAGADAIKLQTYTSETITLPSHLPSHVIEGDSPWRGQTLAALYNEAHTPWQWHAPIFQRAQDRGLWGFSSPFDASSVKFLEQLQVPAYKIASLESTHLPLLKSVAKTKKPLFLSIGATKLIDLCATIDLLRKENVHALVLMRCTSAYPAPPQSANLKTLPHLAQLFNYPVGLSDHTMGIGVAVAAVAHGAKVIEKHLTLDRKLATPDRGFSLEPSEFQQLVIACKQAHLSLGDVTYGPLTVEKSSEELRSSIFIIKDLHSGDEIREDHLKVSRPAKGLSPLEWNRVIGKRVKKDIAAGTPLRWDLLT